MTPFFTRERFGRPQLYAALLLLLLAEQCLWVMLTTPLQAAEIEQISRGLRQWQQGVVTSAPQSPLIALISSAGIAAASRFDQNVAEALAIPLARLPFLGMALLFGASVWYVTHRLFGNAGGYVALTLYCFSPAVVRAGALVNAEGPAAWGFFGGVFSGIALSHTVYALGELPGEQIGGYRRWRWRRIGLLGVAFGIAIGAQFPNAIVILVALAFMLYLAPGRRTACLGIIAVATVIAMFILLAAYFFQLEAFAQAMLEGLRPAGLSSAYTFRAFAEAGPIVVLLFASALVTYLAWRRARYFGNTAPLLVWALLCGVSLAVWPAPAFSLHNLIFAGVFIAGIAADLLESTRWRLVLAVVVVMLVAQAGWCLKRTAGRGFTAGAEIVHPQAVLSYHLKK